MELKKKICIIEDDDSIREIYSTKLQEEGFEVITAENGQKGLYVINDIRPDLILLDLRMPVKNGFEVMKELNEDEKLSKIPVIILTNLDDDGSNRNASKFETRFYLIKSLTSPQKLAGVVREVLH
jgi:DNA-binding response OmpR family regulator